MTTANAIASPLREIAAWIELARGKGVAEPEAMALATCSADGAPSVRFVLCRGIVDESIRFFTNYDSRKARELAVNPRAAAVFHWAVLGRQARVEGNVARVSAADSDAYFASRARGSQLASAISPQSRPIASLEELRERQAALDAKLKGGRVPRPEGWGGFEIKATRAELWIAGADRLHDRVSYERVGSEWKALRLGP